MVAGLLLDGTRTPQDSIHVFRDAAAGRGALFFPLGGERVRCYFIYWKQGARLGLSGPARVPRFLAACVGCGVPRDWLEHAVAAGPLAEFEGADTWVEHPYRDGVALVGDAASSNDPSWGNGLSLALRDVRALGEALAGDEDWDRAGHAYARAHDRHYGVIRKVTTWLTRLMYEVGPQADARRARAFPLMREDRSRSLDYIALGPETPCDEATRRRFFGED